MMSIDGVNWNTSKESSEFGKSLLMRILLLAQTIILYLIVLNFSLWSLGNLCKYHWTITFRPLLARYRWEDGGQKLFAETYYDRDCDRRDFSTSEINDLIIRDEWDFTMAAENILTHGVSVFPKVLDRELADAFRNYTLERNQQLGPEEMVFVMNAKTKSKQTRWSFAFTAQDEPLIIPRMLEQIVNHKKLVDVLELFLGKDPAIIKMQTITQRYKAEHQGWHPDVNAQASVKSHARNFMMHFSLFISLQDTTPKMGATGVCPGTQYCTNVEDYEFGCKQISSGNPTLNLTNETNKHSKPGIWMAGDAVLMNQNTFHRGWKHVMQKGPDRAIVVLTFTSRPRNSNGRIPQYPFRTPLPSKFWYRKVNRHERNRSVTSVDAKNFPIQSWKDEREKLIHPESRVLSLGTPLTSFGFTLYDLKNSLFRMSKVLTLLRCLGIYKPSDASWGWDYATSVFSRISTETHKFKKEDLSHWLSNKRKEIKRNKKSSSLRLWIRSKFMEWYMGKIFAAMPATNQHMGIWDSWISLTLNKATRYFQEALILNFILYVLISILISWVLWTTYTNENIFFNFFGPETHQNRRVNSNDRKRNRRRTNFMNDMLRDIVMVLKIICMVLLILGSVHWKIISSNLVLDIRSGRKLRTSFPNIINETNKNHTPLSLLSMAGIRRITHGRGTIEFVDPTRDDILIGTRFDSLYLRVVNRFLDYHTGNRAWRKRIREASKDTKRGLFFSTSKLIPTVVIDSILREMKGKLLLQTPETGRFTVMTNCESRIFTRRALILEHSLLISELDRSISFMISEMRFESTLRATPMAFFGIGVLEEVRERIFGESVRNYFMDQNKNIKKLDSMQKLYRPVNMLTPLKLYVTTLKSDIVLSLKKKGSRGGIKSQLNNTKKVVSNRKGRARVGASAQKIVQLNKKKRNRR